MTADDVRTTGLGFRAMLMPAADQAFLAARAAGGSQMDGTTAVVDAVEPIIRADERAAYYRSMWAQHAASIRAATEAEVRDRIAQEIEALKDAATGPIDRRGVWLIAVAEAARIARYGTQ